MRSHGYQNYFDNEILAASPVKLVEMLYSAALDSLGAARRRLRDGDVRGRAGAINKTIRIVMELLHCLKHEADGTLSRNLAGLYGYVVRLLIESNRTQLEAPLVEAETLLSTLAEAWKGCTPAPEEHVSPQRETPSLDAHSNEYFAARVGQATPLSAPQ